MANHDEFIERKIIIGLIFSAEYLKKVKPIWDDDYIELPEYKIIAGWCFDHFDEYNGPSSGRPSVQFT